MRLNYLRKASALLLMAGGLAIIAWGLHEFDVTNVGLVISPVVALAIIAIGAGTWFWPRRSSLIGCGLILLPLSFPVGQALSTLLFRPWVYVPLTEYFQMKFNLIYLAFLALGIAIMAYARKARGAAPPESDTAITSVQPFSETKPLPQPAGHNRLLSAIWTAITYILSWLALAYGLNAANMWTDPEEALDHVPVMFMLAALIVGVLAIARFSYRLFARSPRRPTTYRSPLVALGVTLLALVMMTIAYPEEDDASGKTFAPILENPFGQ